MNAIQVGLLGMGTVGSGTFAVLRRNQAEIMRRAGRGIAITMVADLDVIWFKPPDVLFTAPAYLSTGTLFFRDKLTNVLQHQTAFQDSIEAFVAEHTDEYRFNFTAEEGRAEFHANGFSFFWLNVMDRTKPMYNNFQDSSVVS